MEQFKTRSMVRSLQLFNLVALAAVVIAAGTSAHSAELLVGSASKGRLVLFASDNPQDVTVIKLSGLQSDEELLGLDTRPATGELYGLGSSSRLYSIDPLLGIATALTEEPFVPSLSGTHFGFDFNPTVDRIRIVSDNGQNLRAHPETGAVVFEDSVLSYAAADENFGVNPSIAAAAYINNDSDPATGTTLYDIDVELDVLVVQNPPNAGVLNTVGPLGIDVLSIAGFDVAGSDGTAYASLVVADAQGNSDRAGLYTIDLATGAATLIGKIGGPKPLTSLATLGTIP